jgi:hypothetical protein
MDTHKPSKNRILLLVLIILYLAVIGFNSYMEWKAAPDSFEWWAMLLNIPILSIPLVLLFGSIYILVNAYQQRKSDGQVQQKLAKIIHVAPRIAAIMIAFFTGLFSLDVFGTGAPLLEQIGGFLMHSIPSFVMLGLLFFAWKRPAVGFYAFLAAAIIFTAFFVRGFYSLPNLVFFVFPLLMVALLFYADWKWLSPAQGAV